MNRGFDGDHHMELMDNEKSPMRAGGGEEPLTHISKVVTEKGMHNVGDGAEPEILDGHLAELEVDLSRVIGEDDIEGDWDADTSPFPAVRAVVPETDDTEIPINTFRAWFLGIVSYHPGSRIHARPYCDPTNLRANQRMSTHRCSYSSAPASTSSSH